MKIIYITSFFPYGDGEIWAYNEINSILKQGIDVVIIPRSFGRIVKHKNVLELIQKTINVKLFSSKNLLIFLLSAVQKPIKTIEILIWILKQSSSLHVFIKSISVLPKSFYLANKLKSKNVSHVHAFSTTTVAVMAYIISKYLGIPWSETLHTSYLFQPKYLRTFKSHIKSVSFIRTIAKETCNKLDSFLNFEYSDKIKMIHLGVNINKIKNDRGENKIYRKNKIFQIVTPAALYPYKGHNYAILAAYELLSKGIKDFKWIFYGGGPLKSEIIKQIEEFGLKENVFLGGVIDNSTLLKKYQGAEIDLLVLSSVSQGFQPEGIPVSIMEAMSYNIPVIATDNGGISEILEGGAGILVPQCDSASISSEIEKLIVDSSICLTLGINGRERIENEFNSIKNTKELVKLFHL